MTFTGAPNYEALEGWGAQVGGSIAAGVAVGIDFLFVPNGTDPGYTGTSILLGIGAGVEGHGELGYIWIPVHANIFEALDAMKIDIC